MFPKLFNELGKKFGARTEDAVLPSPKRELQDWEKGKVQFGEDMTVHRLPITPEMRASVQEQGQPMFMPQPGNPEALKGAAIKLPDGRILVGGWHGAIDRQVPAQFKGQGVDGFVTNSGRFLTRDEAWVIGKRLGQIPAYARPLNKDQLKSGEQTRPQLISEDIRPPAYMPEKW